MISFGQFEENLNALKARIADACRLSGRSADGVKILPVTKTLPVDAALYAMRAGLFSVGENRVQEAEGKIANANSGIRWELIGHLQSNKAKKAVEIFSRIQSVDSLELAKKINAFAAAKNKIMPVLLQINAGRDKAKFGAEIEAAPSLLEGALALPFLKVEGLMTIAPLNADLDVASKTFETLRKVKENLSQDFGLPLSELSMGMSHDLERAVAEGATLIRVGTFLYGERK